MLSSTCQTNYRLALNLAQQLKLYLFFFAVSKNNICFLDVKKLDSAVLLHEALHFGGYTGSTCRTNLSLNKNHKTAVVKKVVLIIQEILFPLQRCVFKANHCYVAPLQVFSPSHYETVVPPHCYQGTGSQLWEQKASSFASSTLVAARTSAHRELQCKGHFLCCSQWALFRWSVILLLLSRDSLL